MHIFLPLVLSLVVVVAQVDAAEKRFELQQGQVTYRMGDDHKALPLAGAALAIYECEHTLYVAQGASGVSVYDTSQEGTPTLVRQIPTPQGRASGLHVVAGQVWVELLTTMAVPLEEGDALPGVTASSRDAARATDVADAAVVGKQIRLRNITADSVELDVGSDDGVQVGDRFAIYRHTAVGGTFAGRELAAVVTITAVKPTVSLARRGRGQSMSLDDVVQKARSDELASIVLPDRLSNLWELSMVVRPLVKVGTPLGFGVLADADLTYLGNGWFARLRLEPLGFGWTREGNVVTSSVLGEGGYDHRVFAVGLGVGVSAVNGDLDYMLGAKYSYEDATSGNVTVPAYTQRTRNALALSQTVRLGARDGLHIDGHNILLYHKDSTTREEGFVYGGTAVRVVVPLTQQTDLFGEGGGGYMGYAYGALGVFSWLRGTGDAGSLGLSVSVGGASVSGSKELTSTLDGNPYSYREEVSITGPLVASGVVYRFVGWP